MRYQSIVKPPTSPIAVGINDSAKLLGISPITLRQYVREGRISSIKIGSRRLILKMEIDRIIRQAEKDAQYATLGN